MRFSYVSIVLLCLALTGFTSRAVAQTTTTPDAAARQGPLTGKERLGRKWMDEQRIDNCNVPIDKRGTRPRPSACPHIPTG